jgi:hypothetical protein
MPRRRGDFYLSQKPFSVRNALSLSKQFVVGEFNCADYFTQSSQKLEANASKRSIDSFALFNSKALISAKNMAAIIQLMSIEDAKKGGVEWDVGGSLKRNVSRFLKRKA